MTPLESFTKIMVALSQPMNILIITVAIFVWHGIVNIDQIIAFARTLK